MAANQAHSDPIVAAAIEHGFAASEIAAIEKRISGRTCGECTACCRIKGVPELGKPTQKACAHLCATGCAIYAARPASCREYACLWRQGLIEGDERRRPDRLGVMIDFEPFIRIPGTLRLLVWEVTPGAMQSDRVRYVVDKLLRTNKQIKAVAWCAVGEPAHHDYPIDRQAYPGEDPPATLPLVRYDAAHGVVNYEYRRPAA